MEWVQYAGLCFLRLWDKATSDNPAEPRPSALFMLSAPLTMLMEILKWMWREMQEYVWYSVQIRVYSKYTSESGSQCFEEYVDKVAKVSIHSLSYKWRIQLEPKLLWRDRAKEEEGSIAKPGHKIRMKFREGSWQWYGKKRRKRLPAKVEQGWVSPRLPPNMSLPNLAPWQHTRYSTT